MSFHCYGLTEWRVLYTYCMYDVYEYTVYIFIVGTVFVLQDVILLLQYMIVLLYHKEAANVYTVPKIQYKILHIWSVRCLQPFRWQFTYFELLLPSFHFFLFFCTLFFDICFLRMRIKVAGLLKLWKADITFFC